MLFAAWRGVFGRRCTLYHCEQQDSGLSLTHDVFLYLRGTSLPPVAALVGLNALCSGVSVYIRGNACSVAGDFIGASPADVSSALDRCPIRHLDSLPARACSGALTVRRCSRTRSASCATNSMRSSRFTRISMALWWRRPTSFSFWIYRGHL